MPTPDSRDRPGPDPEGFEAAQGEVEDRLRDRARFSETLAQHGFRDVLVLARERVADLDGRHVTILQHLGDHSPPSVRQLAADLGEDKGTISRDLQLLAELDAVELVSEGRSKRPVLKHDHVVLEPLG
jgi:predicted transcriptional regulator